LHLALEELSKTPDDWNALYLHPTKNIRWRYPKRFPYRVIYEVIEDNRLVIIAAVIHAARHDRVWRGRV
jgi:mRNA-degrading endonuclease RelE of RelBE toxin-antitoxin system